MYAAELRTDGFAYGIGREANLGRIVIAGYRPKTGKREEIRMLCLTHVPMLRSFGLVTDRTPLLKEAQDGTVIEVFEWASNEAMASAHAEGPADEH